MVGVSGGMTESRAPTVKRVKGFFPLLSGTRKVHPHLGRQSSRESWVPTTENKESTKIGGCVRRHHYKGLIRTPKRSPTIIYNSRVLCPPIQPSDRTSFDLLPWTGALGVGRS